LERSIPRGLLLSQPFTGDGIYTILGVDVYAQSCNMEKICMEAVDETK
jgi:hypothetical protein